MQDTVKIKIDFQGFWHVGSGRSSGHHLDAICLKDNFGLPFVSGKQLKGLLRHAVRRAESWGWYQDLKFEGQIQNFEELLFGSQSQLEGRYATFAGMLFVDNAQLSESEYQWLQHNKQAALREHLYQELYSTAIDENTGTAVEHSLRGIEVTLPVQLFASLQLQVTALDETLSTQQSEFLKRQPWLVIERALPLIDAIGAHRSRGLGEAIVSFADNVQG